MKYLLVLFTTILFALSINSIFAQDESKGMNEEMMKKMQEYMDTYLTDTGMI